MNKKYSCQENSGAWLIAIIILASLLLFGSSAGASLSLDLAKNATVDTPGGTIHEGTILTCTYKITNTGNETISNIVVTDARNYPTPGSNVTIPSTGDLGSLQPAKSITINDSYKVTEADICALGGLIGIATARGKDLQGGDVFSISCKTTNLVELASALIIRTESVSHPLHLAYPGDEVSIKYIVTNPAYSEPIYMKPTTVHGLVVVDSKLGKISMNKTDLKPGEISTGTKTYKVPKGITSFSSVAEADADSCASHVLAGVGVNLQVINPDMAIAVASDKGSGKLNDTLTFTINVTNKGDSILNNVVVVDTLPKGLTFVDEIGSSPKPVQNPPPVNPDGTTTLTYTMGQLTQSSGFDIDIVARFNGDASGKLHNIAEVNATDISNMPIVPRTATKDVTA